MGFKDVVTAQDGRVQTAGRSRACTPPIDSLGSAGIGAEVVTRLRPAVLEDPGPGFPLGRQSGADRIGNQVVNVGT